MIALIDYEVGNINSLAILLEDLNLQFCITRDEKIIKNSTKIILPGVSNFSYCISNIMKFGLDKILKNEIIDKKKPVLGICSGMQILCNSSEEGNVKGLGFVSGDIKKFPDEIKQGWFMLARTDDWIKIPVGCMVFSGDDHIFTANQYKYAGACLVKNNCIYHMESSTVWRHREPKQEYIKKYSIDNRRI